MDRYLPGAPARVARFLKKTLSIAAVLIAALYLMPAQAQSIATFGKTAATGANPSAGLTAHFKRASRFTLTEPATVKEVCAFIDGNGGASGMQWVQFALYTDVNGAPARKVFDTSNWALSDGAAGQWICRPHGYIAVIPAGQYWIAIQSSEPGGIIRAFSSGSSQNSYSNADTFEDGPADSFGSGTPGTGTLAAYVRYYPDSQLRSAGRTSIGTLASRGMTANFKRGSSFVMPGRGKLFAVTAYLDGRGSTNFQDQQAYRYVIYKDSSGVPGEKIYESILTHYFRGTWAPTWTSEVPYPGTAPTLDAGRYWLTLHAGGVVAFGGGLTDTGDTIRYYYDHTGNWYGNDDAFADGASTPFGAGTAKNDLISAYISYRPGTITTGELGRTDIGTTPSRGLDPDVTRWSSFNMQDLSATLTGLHAYLDGLGSTTGSQALRMVLYGLTFERDETGEFTVVYYKIAQSDVVTIAAGMPRQWVKFPVPAIAIPDNLPANFLVGIQSGPNPVARVYGDNRPGANWHGRPDTFADGPVDKFLESEPAIKSGTVTLSVYASYSIPPP